MVMAISGNRKDGTPCIFYINSKLKEELDKVKPVVLKKNWDYVAIIAGNPGVGKSTLAMTIARYFCPWFDENYITFNAEEFVKVTNDCPKFSAIVLDESFMSLNTKSTMSPEFVKIVNHLQIIRQKNLFIILCLPNFFDLAKGIAIYRSHNLFVCYGDSFGERGKIAAFGRNKKTALYVLGGKFMNYHAVAPNFRCDFTKQKVVDEEVYEAMKLEHLKQNDTKQEQKITKEKRALDNLWKYLIEKKLMKVNELDKVCGIDRSTIYRHIKTSV
jgi:ABC-type dipeptide/oligopeptide/nickel transport system ATPase subunit